jgi:hypothetical protein
MPLSPVCVFLWLFAWLTAKIAAARTPRAAKPGDKALWSATQTYLATPRTGYPDTHGGGTVAYYPRYPAVDRMLDLLFETGVPATSICCAQSAGRYHISVLLPGHRFTPEYEGSSLQSAALNWLNGEAETFAVQVYAHAKAAA